VHARRSLFERLADHDAERLEATLRSVVDGAVRSQREVWARRPEQVCARLFRRR
jgi:CHASE1-domain containing sensor protein